jgi:hypothetical protein
VTQRYATAASRALELLGKIPEVNLFGDVRVLPAQAAAPRWSEIEVARRLAYMLHEGPKAEQLLLEESAE